MILDLRFNYTENEIRYFDKPCTELRLQPFNSRRGQIKLNSIEMIDMKEGYYILICVLNTT